MTIITMEREPHDIHDIWRLRWSEPALQGLGRWLTGHGTPDAPSAAAVESFWIFYSYDVLPALRAYVPMGIAARETEGGPAIHCYLPAPKTVGIDIPAPTKLKRRLAGDFERRIGAPLRADLIADLRFVAPRSPADFVGLVSQRSFEEHCDFLGTYGGDLDGDLRRLVAPDAFDEWLNTPNDRLAGKLPGELLGDPERDRALRDLILADRHGAFA